MLNNEINFSRHIVFILLQFDRLPNPQSILAYIKNLAPEVGLEPTTFRLTAECIYH